MYGNFSIDYSRYLGSGYYSTVYEGIYQNTRVAVKVFHDVDGVEEQCDNEMKILTYTSSSRNRFRNIIELKGSAQANGHAFTLLSLCNGRDLFDYISSRQDEFDQDPYIHDIEQKAKKCILDVAYALADLHKHKIIHRDIKGENIIYVDESETSVMLVDFGCSVLLPQSASKLSVKRGELLKGTPLYRAPEVLLRGEYSPKSDIWALGVTLYALLSGRSPFSDEKNLQASQIKNGAYFPLTASFWGKISIEAKDLLAMMLMLDPEKRFSAMDILNHPWIVTEINRVANQSEQFISKSNLSTFSEIDADFKSISDDSDSSRSTTPSQFY